MLFVCVGTPLETTPSLPCLALPFVLCAADRLTVNNHFPTCTAVTSLLVRLSLACVVSRALRVTVARRRCDVSTRLYPPPGFVPFPTSVILSYLHPPALSSIDVQLCFIPGTLRCCYYRLRHPAARTWGSTATCYFTR